MNNAQSPAIRKENIAHEAIQILKTVMLLEQSYAASYLVRILQADERYKFRKIAHQDLETYGVLEDLRFSRLEDIIHYLSVEGFLTVKNGLYGTMDITDKGREYLENPYDLEVPRSELFRTWVQIQLDISLRSLRREQAEQSGRPPYELYTNYVMSTIARQMPATLGELEKIPGMKNLGQPLKEAILGKVQEMHALLAQNEASEGAVAKAFSPGHRKIRELFEAGFSVEDISRRRNLKPGTIRSYLADLYEAGQLDLKPWIEQEVESQTLHKGREYFKSAKSPRLNEAKEVLGYDYDVLRLCRAYANQVGEPMAAYG